MRAPSWRLLLAACAAIGLGLVSARAADDKTELKGNWKFSVYLQPFSETTLMIIGVQEKDGKTSAELKNAPPQYKGISVSKFASDDDKVSFTVKLPGTEGTFSGARVKDGNILGVLSINGQSLPTALEKTDAETVQPDRPDPTLMQAYFASRGAQDPKDKAKKLRDLIQKAPGNPKISVAYSDLLKVAGDAELDEKTVRGVVKEWVDGATGYGPAYAAQIQTQVLAALTGQKPYADLTLDLATEAEKSLGKDASVETRAQVASALASAAKLAGKDGLAREAAARAAKLENQLDEEYNAKVPPFKPEISLGRKDKKNDRVVLFELFTGAQCPPCVGADVAFDALLKTYKPSELIALEYHLHIPGPDPLTNADSEARQHYYPDLRGTPATYFNGKAEASGGGFMPQSKMKYDQYRQVIDKALDGSRKATVDLEVTRAGDEIKIVATAQADAKKAEKKDGCADEPKSEVKLRLALIEEEIRYVGGNKMRFHHHVVRALPGGAEGKALVDGQGKAEATVKLSDLRKGLEEYLSDFAKKSPFPNPLPPIKLDHLSVVAFVQDDADKSVLHAVLVPVKSETP